ncbi:MAG: nucleotidyltransferase domain-containing protein [Candidatus Woesearchaeota archaeon]|nr:MAG: nucleotidyltransferase domain-containing protein [Candidatus Woesearchaeota archaeon]
MPAKNSQKKKTTRSQDKKPSKKATPASVTPAPATTGLASITAPGQPQLNDEALKKLNEIKDKLLKLKDKLVSHFDKYIMGLALLPSDEKDRSIIHALLLVDDMDVKRMSREELEQKIIAIVQKISAEVDKNIKVDVRLLSSIWQDCYDQKLDVLKMFASSVPVYDTGMVAAIRIAEVHKTMVLEKFERYIVSYVLAGSLVQGKATPESDIDVFVVIDDTDVKKMTRAELRDKLREIIITQGFQAGKLTGVENKINIQVYILTDFWDMVKEANPIIFTFLRDGIPFFDRGIFMPWKQLLKMGRIKPSPEAIDMFMHSGEQFVDRVKAKLREIGVEDFFWATITPSQAALMLYGLPPPTPKETVSVLREVFVKKEKLMEEKYVKIVEKILQVRKDIEHGVKKSVTGKELDELLEGAESYLKMLRGLFDKIETLKEKERMIAIYDDMMHNMKDVLRLEKVATTEKSNPLLLFKKHLVDTGKIPVSTFKMAEKIAHAKTALESGKLSKPELVKVVRENIMLLKFLVDYVQRKRSFELTKTKIRVKHGESFGEVILLGDVAFVLQDISKPEEVKKAALGKDGKLTNLTKSSLQELETALADVSLLPKVFIKEATFESLKMVFGTHVEILLNY